MKKNFFKKLASGLALAMVVTSFAPAAPAFAASATKIVEQGGKKAPQTVYVGKKVDYSLNNVYKTNTYKWFTSNAKIAKIAQTTGVVTPVAPGKATIKVNAYKKSTGKFIKSFKLDLDVKLRATSVDIGAEDFELAVGEEKDLNAVKTPANSTDTLRYFSSDEKVATVDVKTGVVKAVAAGEATIKVASKGAWFTANNSKYNKYDEVKVTVVDGLLKVEQTKANEIALTFSSDMKDAGLKVSDVEIVRDETKQVIAVKELAVDGKVVKATTFENMVDGKAYTVTNKEKALQFVATDNVVASISIEPTTIAYDTPTKVEAVTKDSKGVELGRYDLTETEAKVDFSIETVDGYIANDKLVLFKIGDTAKAKATWHTFKYDDKGNEIGVLNDEVTITAVDKTAVTVADQKYTIANETPDLKDFKANTRIAIGDLGYKFYFYQKDSAKNVVTDKLTYTFESSNKDVLLVNTSSVVGNFQTAELTAVAQGSAYVLVKKDDKVVYSLPVTIVAARVATTLELSDYTVTLSNSQAADDKKTITVTVRDQYGDKMAAPAIDAVTSLTAPSIESGKGLVNVDYTTTAGKIVLSGANATKGTYIFQVKEGNLPTRTFTVNVQQPSGTTEQYQLVVSDTKVDVAFGADTKAKDITAKVAITRGGVVDGYVNLVASGAVITLKNGSTTKTLTPSDNYTVTIPAIAIDGNKVVTKAAKGSYALNIAFGTNNLTKGFVIEDSQAGITVVKKLDSVTGSSIEAGVAKAYEFYYRGDKLTNPSIRTLIAYNGTNASNYNYVKTGSSYHINNVIIEVPVVGKDSVTYYVPITAKVGTSIVFSN